VISPELALVRRTFSPLPAGVEDYEPANPRPSLDGDNEGGSDYYDLQGARAGQRAAASEHDVVRRYFERLR
jgi:hypothetical protein